MGIPVRSKNITSRRRSLYLISPGLAGAIWVASTGLTTLASNALAWAAGTASGLGASFFGSGLGAGAVAGAGIAVSSSSWYSKTLTVCGLPSSVTVKSAVFRPLMGLPSLSFADMLTTTNWVVASSLKAPLGAFCAG